MKQVFIITFVMLLAFTIQAEAQVSCLDSTGCSIIDSNKTISMGLRDPDCDVTIHYEVWDCGGIKSIKINSYTVDGSCTAMTDFSIYHYSLSSLEEYISLALIERETEESGTIPLCCSCLKLMIKLYTASCGIWVACEYEVNPASMECDSGYV